MPSFKVHYMFEDTGPLLNDFYVNNKYFMTFIGDRRDTNLTLFGLLFKCKIVVTDGPLALAPATSRSQGTPSNASGKLAARGCPRCVRRPSCVVLMRIVNTEKVPSISLG